MGMAGPSSCGGEEPRDAAVTQDLKFGAGLGTQVSTSGECP